MKELTEYEKVLERQYRKRIKKSLTEYAKLIGVDKVQADINLNNDAFFVSRFIQNDLPTPRKVDRKEMVNHNHQIR